MRIQRGTVRSQGFAVVQMHDATDVNGNNYDYSNLLTILGGGARYTWEIQADGTRVPVQVPLTVGIFGNWVIWPGKDDRSIAQIAQVFAVKITSASPLKAQPFLNQSLDLDDTLDEVEVVALDGSSPSVDDVGQVISGTALDNQELIFVPHGTGGGGGGGAGGWYGSGQNGALTAPSDLTTWGDMHSWAESFVTSGGDGVQYGIADGIYIHYMNLSGFIEATTLDIPAGVVVVLKSSGQVVRCTTSLNVDGELSASGKYAAYYKKRTGSNLAGGFAIPGLGGVVGNGGAGNAPGTGVAPPYDEGSRIIISDDTSKYSGTGGGDGAGHTGGGGTGRGQPAAREGDGGVGNRSGTSSFIRFLPGAVLGTGINNPGAGTVSVSAGGCSGGGGACADGHAAGEGGWGGGALVVCAKVLTGSGTISADGGPGQQPASGASNAGGGGGGNPGGMSIASDDETGFAGTFSHAPGAGGTGVGTGSAGGTAGGAGWEQHVDLTTGVFS